jgi:two-component system, cell cycle sensor histidine kinase and response regulator CckA
MMDLKRKIVLVVDDEALVRKTVRGFLESLGVYVLEAEDAPMAVKLATETPLSLDLLITDVLLPYVNGRDLANKVCLHRPDLKVLFISGYPIEVLESHSLCPSQADLLLKPFSRLELAGKVTQVLERGASWKDLSLASGNPVADAA